MGPLESPDIGIVGDSLRGPRGRDPLSCTTTIVLIWELSFAKENNLKLRNKAKDDHNLLEHLKSLPKA